MIHLLWATLAIPVIIHLVYRRKARRVPFSTLYFLKMIDQRVARRQRLKELLLLLLRLALLAALIGALEKPMLRSATFKGAAVPTTAAIVLDNTYSMMASAGGTTAFGRAKTAAAEILDGLEPEDAACLVLLQSPDEVPPTPTTAIEELRTGLEAMQCGHGTGQLAPAIRRALKSLEAATNPRKELYIITDMQKLCWTNALGELARDFPQDVPTFLVDVGGPAENNLTLREVNFALKVNVVGAPSTLFCDVANSSPKGTQRNLSLYLEGEKVATQTVRLAPQGNVAAVFAHTFQQTGTFSGYVELEPDQLMADNRRYFTVRVHDRVPVLIVNGRPSTIPFQDGAFYLKLALQASADPQAALSPIRPDVIEESEFMNRPLDRYACVILAEVPRIEDRWTGRIRDYVARGGGLLIFCGPLVDPPSYNVALGGQQGEAEQLLPARLERLRTAAQEQDAFFSVGTVDRQHPMLRDIIDEIDLSTTQIRAFFSTAPWHETQEPACPISLDDGPLLLEKRVGDGTVMLCTTSCNLQWSNMPLKPYFLPLLHQMVYYVSRAGSREPATRVGLDYRLDIPQTTEPVEVTFYGPPDQPGDETEQVPIGEPVTGKGPIVFKHTDRPGIYTARYALEGAQYEQSFAVNVEAAEGNLESLPEEEARKMLALPNLKFIHEPEGLARAVRREREGLPLWDYLLLATILLAVCESFVGNVVLKH